MVQSSVILSSSQHVAWFLDARYCGAPEASWRLFAFPLQGRSHAVERLPVHLPLQQNVLFQQGSESDAVRLALTRPSKLEAWFRLNAGADSHDSATASLIRSLRYPDLPRFFTWCGKESSWKPRKRGAKVMFIVAHSVPSYALQLSSLLQSGSF